MCAISSNSYHDVFVPFERRPLSPCLPFLRFAGPWLWHFENNTDDPLMGSDLVEVKALVRKMRFRLSVRLSPFLLDPG